MRTRGEGHVAPMRSGRSRDHLGEDGVGDVWTSDGGEESISAW